MILISMRQHVFVPGRPKIERLVANATCKLLFIGMHRHVVFEVAQCKKLPPAIRTSELLVTRMRESVPA
jgi:hypothetical protein